MADAKFRDRVKSLRRVRASDLVPSSENWRRHPDGQASALRGVLSDIGFAGAILAREREDGKLVVLDGHLRRDLLPDQEVPVLVLDVTEDEGRKILATYDPIGAMAETDDKALRSLLGSIESGSEDMRRLLERIARAEGLEFLPELKTDPDEIPEPRLEAVSRTGDLWVMGEQRILCGDATKPTEVDHAFAGLGKAGLIATDAPYGVAYNSTKNGIPRSGFRDQIDRWGGDIAGDELNGAALQTFLESAFRAALPHLDHAAWYLWHAHLTEGFFAAAAAAAANVVLHRQIVWVKAHLVLTRSGQYHWKHEPAFYGWVRGQQPKWLADASQTSVWELPHDSGERLHPTQKPVALFEIPIRNHIESGEIAYEPFAGSGSQIIAAERLGRRCAAIEIEPRFVDVSVRRWQQVSGRAAVLEGTGKTFDEMATERLGGNGLTTT